MRYSLAKDNIKVLLLEGVHQTAVSVFNAAGYSNVVQQKQALDEQALIQALADVRILGIRSRSQLTQAVLQAAPKLLAVGCFCIGTNQVDLITAEQLGIPVFNAPFANTRSVAEMVLAEMVLLLRQIPAKSMLAHQGEWQKTAGNAFETRGKTLGIIGYGHIGSQLSILAENLGMRVQFYDIEKKLPLGNAQQVSDLATLLRNADVVSLHVPETPQTQNMIGKAELGMLKPTAVLINASRGTVVDIDALADCLKKQQILGAAIDVFPKEPVGNNEKFVSPLQNLPNVILTPHIGGSTAEAQEGIGIEVADKLVKYSDNGSSISAVNFPQVALPPHPGESRLLHIHRNQPGVLKAINEMLSRRNINVSGQYLQTTREIGYVVLDAQTDDTEGVLSDLRQVPGTIRARVLY
jgi:D-3-phosphoglycerate dehydrogenase